MVKRISHALREKREFYRKTENGNAENKKKAEKRGDDLDKLAA